uniref:Uncharacterized protein n=1 Tax=Panagrolaimus sp. ES5 TaxID=591445 RepID=A0AC34FLD6_9BILA
MASLKDNRKNSKTFDKKVIAAAKKGTSFFVYVERVVDGCKVQVFDLVTCGIIAKSLYTASEIVNIATALPELDKCKVVLFNIFSETSPQDFFSIAKKLKIAFDAKKIATHFGSREWWYFASKVSIMHESLEIGDRVIVAKINPGLTLSQFMLDKKGLSFVGFHEVLRKNHELDNLDAFDDDLLAMNGHVPKLVTLWSQNLGDDRMEDNLQRLKKMFKEKFKTTKVTDCDGLLSLPKFLRKVCKNVLGGADDDKMHWLQLFSARQVHISATKGVFTICGQIIDYYYLLPFIKTVTLSRLCVNVKVQSRYGNRIQGSSDIIKNIPFQSACHRLRVIVSINENNVITVKHEKEMIKSIVDLPRYLTEFADINIGDPIVAFFDTSSTILIAKEDHDEQKCVYHFMDEWNGVFGRDLLIAFNKEKPTFFEEAFTTFKKKPSFVVHDLLQLMSYNYEEVDENDSRWSFKAIQDKEHGLLIECDHFGGCRQVQTPEYHFAMLMKEHVKAIKKHLKANKKNGNTKRLGFLIVDKYTPEKLVRIRDKIAKACTLLNIVCYFVEIE